MQLTAGVAIQPGDQVTRQTLYNLVANASIGTVAASDLATELLSVVTQSNAPSGFPGKLWYDQTDQLMKVYVDVVDSTGCSVWCAIGPDRFDLPVLATEPIPFGAAVKLTGAGRAVALPLDPVTLNTLGKGYREWENAKVLGFNNNGTQATPVTAASGTWFAAAVDGIVWAWYPVDYTVTGLASAGDGVMDALIFGAANTLTGPSGISNVRGGVFDNQGSELQAQDQPALLLSTFRITARQGINWARRPFSGARIMKHTA